MKLSLLVDTLDAVPDALRAHYVPHNRKFLLNVDGFAPLAAQWEGRIAALTAERDAALASECRALTDATLDAAIAKAGANAMGRELLPQLLRKRLRVEVSPHGVRSVRFFKDDERTAMKGSGKDGAATWDDLMAEARSKFPSMFRD